MKNSNIAKSNNNASMMSSYFYMNEIRTAFEVRVFGVLSAILFAEDGILNVLGLSARFLCEKIEYCCCHRLCKFRLSQ